jgi:hypothetical protein
VSAGRFVSVAMVEAVTWAAMLTVTVLSHAKKLVRPSPM